MLTEMANLIPKLKSAVADIWPSASAVQVPDRVVERIEKYDDLSEILVKIIQFTIFALWGTAYLLAPQPNPETVSKVPLIISIYLIFTLLRLFIDLTSRSPVWLIYFSIIVDMALLTYLIWSFHIQYNQPASFSLKVVEVMNYFVLIGLRSLRFEARYVIASGLVAILCWVLMVLYVVFNDPSDTMITRDYVTYLTSNSILVGAEISKIFSIGMFTIILAIAVRRAHYFLVSSVSEESAAHDLSRFMPDSVAKHIRGSKNPIEAGQGVRREVAVLNVDIRGFSHLVADMDPSDAMALLSDYQHKIVPIIHQHNGVIDKYLGDGIMATFGAFRQGEEPYCANALNCIEQIHREQSTWTDSVAELNVNMAVTAGPVIFGAVGDGDRLELTVVGPAVNLSAKVEKHNKVLGSKIIAGQFCVDRAKMQGFKVPSHYRTVSTTIGDDPRPTKLVIVA